MCVSYAVSSAVTIDDLNAHKLFRLVKLCLPPEYFMEIINVVERTDGESTRDVYFPAFAALGYGYYSLSSRRRT